VVFAVGVIVVVGRRNRTSGSKPAAAQPLPGLCDVCVNRRRVAVCDIGNTLPTLDMALFVSNCDLY
jgi:hypothetical protein